MVVSVGSGDENYICRIEEWGSELWPKVNRSASASVFFDQQASILWQITLSAKPIFHGVLQFSQRHLGADLHQAVAQRQGIIKNAGIREVAHREAVQPLQRTGVLCPILLVFHADSPSKHSFLITSSNLS